MHCVAHSARYPWRVGGVQLPVFSAPRTFRPENGLAGRYRWTQRCQFTWVFSRAICAALEPANSRAQESKVSTTSMYRSSVAKQGQKHPRRSAMACRSDGMEHMARNRPMALVAASCFFAALGAYTSSVNAQLAGAKGLSSKTLAEVNFAAEKEPVQARTLRSRLVTLDVGGSTPAHSHKDRPSIIYVLQGTLSEERGAVTKVYGPGNSIPVGRDVTHVIRNDGGAPVSFIETDITK